MVRAKPESAIYEWRWVFRGFALVILALAALSYFLPSDYRIERSVIVDASRTDVLSFLLRADQWESWLYIKNGELRYDGKGGPLQKGDSFTISYSSTAKQGKLELVEINQDSIVFQVVPKKGVFPVSNDIFLDEKSGRTTVRWSIEGELSAGFAGPYLAMFANQISGSHFEASLSRLKQQVEED